MLSEEMRMQVKTVQHLRRAEDTAFRDVMAISNATPLEEILRRADWYKQCVQVVQREEHNLSSMVIKESRKETEKVAF